MAHPSEQPAELRVSIGFVHLLQELRASHVRLRDRPAHPWMKEVAERNSYHNGAISAYDQAIAAFEEQYGPCAEQ